MSRKDWRIRVEDIVEAAMDVAEMTADMDFDNFVASKPVRLGVLYCLAVIGEAARHVPADVQARHPEVEWRLMNDMRNVIIHDYSGVNLHVVSVAVRNDLPPTLERLRRLLESEAHADG